MTRGQDELHQTFERAGFVHIQSFMNSQEMLEVETNLVRFFRDILPTLSETQAMYDDYSKPETLKYIGNLERFDPYFAGLLSAPKIVGLAEVLLDTKAVPQHGQYFSKPPGSAMVTPPHQDGFYFCLFPNEAVTLWIPLDDIDDENGALHYVKGSHKLGVLPHAASFVLGFSQELQEGPKAALGENVTCRVRRGDCVAHHSLTVHSAGANCSLRQRRAISFVYYSERANVDEEGLRRYQESLRRQQRQAGVD